MNYIDGFLYIQPSLHLWDETYLIMMDDCFDVFLDSGGKNFLFVCLGFFSQGRVSLCSSGCLGSHSVEQAGLELRKLPASASQVLGL